MLFRSQARETTGRDVFIGGAIGPLGEPASPRVRHELFAEQAAVLESPEVGVIDVEWGARRDLHRKYSIDAVPVIAIADADGVVRRGFTGPVTATDLWAAVADARQPGSSPEPELGN